MISYISGEAARGAIVRSGTIVGHILDGDREFELAREALPRFFLHALDIETVECDSEQHLKQRIEAAWKRDRALRLTMLAFDSSQRISTRRESAACAEELLADADCQAFVRYHLYAKLLPAQLNVDEVSSLLVSAEAQLVDELLQGVSYRQSSIAACLAAWDAVPSEIFDDASQRESVRLRILKTGAFYHFAVSAHGDNHALFKLFADPILASRSAQTREIFRHWASRYREVSVPAELLDYSDDQKWLEKDSNTHRSASAYETFVRVKKQKAQIKIELQEGNSSRAMSLIEDLIGFQRLDGSSEYLAKSLCDLANFAKSYGDTDLYLTLSIRATEEAPQDAWSFVQLGYALMIRSDYAEALNAFERAEVLGDERTAMIGRAETLKYLGQMDVALQVLDVCTNKFPLDSVSRNSRASVLAHFGRFDEALEIYGDLVSSVFADKHSFGGRAAVLSDLGRFDEALTDVDVSIHLSNDDVIPYCAKADILREAGLFAESLDALKAAPKSFASSLRVQNARARVYQDQGKYDLAATTLRAVREKYPKDSFCRMQLAEVARKTGDFALAAAELHSMERDFPRSKFARNSVAALYASSGDFERALSALPAQSPVSRSDWVSQHIRGLVMLRLGRVVEAEEILTNGLEHCPWIQQRPYFASALALVAIYRRDYPKVIATLDGVEHVGSPLNEAIFSTLRMQAHAASANIEEMSNALATARSSSNPLIQKLLVVFEIGYLAADNDADFLCSEAFLEAQVFTALALAA